MIYFAQVANKDGYIKIGRAVNPWKRLKSLQGCSPYKLILLRVMPTRRAYTKEIELHQKFAHLHVLGEWFECAPELVNFIATLPYYKDLAEVKAKKSSWEREERERQLKILRGEETERSEQTRQAFEKMGDLIEEM